MFQYYKSNKESFDISVIIPSQIHIVNVLDGYAGNILPGNIVIMAALSFIIETYHKDLNRDISFLKRFTQNNFIST